MDQHHTSEEIVSRWASKGAEELNKVPIPDHLLNSYGFLYVFYIIVCRIVSPIYLHNVFETLDGHCCSNYTVRKHLGLIPDDILLDLRV